MVTTPQSDILKAGIAKGDELLRRIQQMLNGVELKGDHRHRIPAQLFDLSLDHASGILRLISVMNYASAFALVRCEFECFVRGAWLHHRATDAEIERFIEKDEIGLKFGDLLEALEKAPPFEDKFLSSVKEKAWTPMNGYTHGGIHQVSRRLQANYIEPVFEDEAVLEAVQFAGTMAIIAIGEIATLAGRRDLQDEAQAMMDSGASVVLPERPFTPAVA